MGDEAVNKLAQRKCLFRVLLAKMLCGYDNKHAGYYWQSDDKATSINA